MENDTLDNLVQPVADAPEPNTEAEDQLDEQPQADDESSDESQAPEIDTEEVEFNGKTLKLPKDVAEVIKTRESMQRDFTQKWQSAADFKREAEAYRQEVQREAETNEALFDDVSQQRQIQARIEYLASINSMALPADQQQQFILENMKLTQDNQALNGRIEQRRADLAAYQEHSDATLKSQAAAELNKPDERLGWAGKFDEPTRATLTAFGKELGFSDLELSSIRNPTAIKTLQLAKIGFETLKKQRAATAPKRVEALPVPQVGGAKAKVAPRPENMNFAQFKTWREKTSKVS